jgi:hypothetical protein
MKNGQAFPDPVKGDPSLLGAIHRRQPMPPAGAQFANLPTGIVISNKRQRKQPAATGENLNLLIQDKYFTVVDGKMVYGGSANSMIHRWRNGIYKGAFSVMSPPFDGDDELTIVERSVDNWTEGTPP